LRGLGSLVSFKGSEPFGFRITVVGLSFYVRHGDRERDRS